MYQSHIHLAVLKIKTKEYCQEFAAILKIKIKKLHEDFGSIVTLASSIDRSVRLKGVGLKFE
jgi:hypothetical protein